MVVSLVKQVHERSFLRTCIFFVGDRFTTIVRVVLDSGDAAFEFNHSAAQRSHDRRQTVAKQKQRYAGDNQNFPMSRKHASPRMIYDQQTCGSRQAAKAGIASTCELAGTNLRCSENEQLRYRHSIRRPQGVKPPCPESRSATSATKERNVKNCEILTLLAMFQAACLDIASRNFSNAQRARFNAECEPFMDRSSSSNIPYIAAAR